MSEDIEFIDVALSERRSLETALADLVAKQKRAPRPELARMIRGIEAEIVQRQPAIRGIGGACLPTRNPLV
jgi:hypothetical protein